MSDQPPPPPLTPGGQYKGSTDELVGAAEFCARTGASRWTFARMCRDKVLPSVAVGSRYRIPRQAFETWLRNGAPTNIKPGRTLSMCRQATPEDVIIVHDHTFARHLRRPPYEVPGDIRIIALCDLHKLRGATYRRLLVDHYVEHAYREGANRAEQRYIDDWLSYLRAQAREA